MTSLRPAADERPELPRGVYPPQTAGMRPRRLGEAVVALGLADEATVRRCAERAQREGRPLGPVLLEEGVVDERGLARALAERNRLLYVDLNEFEVDWGAANLIDAAHARRMRAVPIAFWDEGTLLVAVADPANLPALDEIELATGLRTKRAIAAAGEIDALLRQLSEAESAVAEIEEDAISEEPGEAEIVELRDVAEEAPVVRLVNSVIADAVERGASDIHFEPTSGDMRVRLRVDGVVRDSTTIPRALVPGVVSRLKIMAELDISERRVPQDGRIGLTVGGRHVDLRVATLPVARGEAVVLRVLDPGRALVKLDELGLDDADRELLERTLKLGHGAILATGPTGSGKTTTLYAALNLLNEPERTIVTIEDPVEYEIDGIKQVPVNVKAGLTFARGLRAIVRADPDVVMVGEIRDRETAQIAIEAALTGHLVLSTLHANDSATAAARLIDMGVEPFLVASSLECVIAQRLARRLCDCKQPLRLTRKVLRENGFGQVGPIDAFAPGGCVRCAGTGFRGRVGIYEMLRFDDELRALVLERASADRIRRAARQSGLRTLREAALDKVRAGVTSLDEVLRALGTAA